MNRDEFAAALEEAFDAMMMPLTKFSSELVTQPLAEGDWSLKELAAHFIVRDQIAVRALEACFRGEGFDGSRQAESNRLPEQSAPHTRVAAEWQITHTTVMEALRRVPDEKLLEDGGIPRGLIEHVLDHYRHHAVQVKAWTERLKRDGGTGLEELTVLR